MSPLFGQRVLLLSLREERLSGIFAPSKSEVNDLGDRNVVIFRVHTGSTILWLHPLLDHSINDSRVFRQHLETGP